MFMADNRDSKNIEKTFTFEDLQTAWERFDWEAHCRRVDEAIAPQIEAYRRASAQSRADAKYHVFV